MWEFFNYFVDCSIDYSVNTVVVDNVNCNFDFAIAASTITVGYSTANRYTETAQGQSTATIVKRNWIWKCSSTAGYQCLDAA